MTKPVPIKDDPASGKLFAKDFSNENDERTIRALVGVLSKGMRVNKSGTVYATFSEAPFDKEYDDVQLKLFPET